MTFPKDSEFICVDRFDPALYERALNWVDDERRVAFISNEERESTDPRVKIYHLESPLQLDGFIKKIAWSAVQKKLTVIGDDRFKEKLEECHLAAALLLSEASGFCVKILENARANNKPYLRGMDLKGAFSGIPALIVGAGPSLEKNGHLIKEFEDKALIFAGGSALNVIDTEPHFAASIDPEAPYKQFKAHPFSETPFFYQARMNAENFSIVHAKKILFPDSSSDAINWIYDEETFESGWTVGNFLTAIAVYLGCSPIIFVGMDLCYHKGKKYAQIDSGVPEGLVEVRGVWTQRDWLMAARWTEELSKGKTFIDATEGGILNLPKESLQSVLDKCPYRKDLRKSVQKALFSLDEKSPLNQWKEWDASLQRLKKGVDLIEMEVVYQKLLLPLWQVWRHIFERVVEIDPKQKIEIHRALFFQQVLQEHG